MILEFSTFIEAYAVVVAFAKFSDKGQLGGPVHLLA